MLRLLLWKLRIELARSRANRAGVIVPIVILVVFGLTLWGMHALFSLIVRIAPPLADGVLLAGYAALAVFGVLASLRWGTQRLFLSSDLELLGVLPIPLRSILVLKTTEMVLASPISLLLATSLTWGYLSARDRPMAFLIAPIMAFVLALGASLPGVLATLIIVRWLSQERLRLLVAVLPTLLSVLLILVGPAIGELVEGIDEQGVDPQRFAASGHSLTAALRALPSSWLASIVIPPRGSEALPPAVGAALTLAGIAAAGVLTYVVFRRTFRHSWTQLMQTTTRIHRGGILERLVPPLPGTMRAMVLKDWRWFTRDVRALAQSFFPLLIFAYLTISNFGEEGGGVFSTPFVLLFVASGVASTALLYERRNVALLRQIPIRGTDVLLGKLVAFGIPVTLLVFGGTVVLGITSDRPAVELATLSFVGVWTMWWVMLTHVAITALWARFDVERPSLGFQGVLINFVATAVAAGSQGLFGAWIASRIGVDVGPFGHPLLGIPAILLAGGGCAAALALTSAAGRRLERIDAH